MSDDKKDHVYDINVARENLEEAKKRHPAGKGGLYSGGTVGGVGKVTYTVGDGSPETVVPATWTADSAERRIQAGSSSKLTVGQTTFDSTSGNFWYYQDGYKSWPHYNVWCNCGCNRNAENDAELAAIRSLIEGVEKVLELSDPEARRRAFELVADRLDVDFDWAETDES